MDGHNDSKCLKVQVREIFTLMYISGTPGNYNFSGPLINILQIWKQHLGICYEFIVSDEQVYGSILPNGSWTGLLGEVQRREVDFSSNVFTITPDTLKSVDVSEPIYIDEMSVLYIRPSVSPNILGFVMPYTNSVWLLMLGVFLVMIGATTVIVRGDILLHQSRRQEDASALVKVDRGWLWSFEKSFLWTWSSLLAHSVPWEPVTDLVRYTAGLWLLTVLILANVYRSNLKAMLTIPRIDIPFDSVEELADSDISTAIIKDTKIYRQIMAADKSSSLGRLQDQLVTFNLDEAVVIGQNIFNGHYACINYKRPFQSLLHTHFSQTGKCGAYMISKGYMGPSCISMIFPKGSLLRDKFNPLILSMTESGIMSKTLSEGTVNATECAKPLTSLADPAHRPLQLLDFYGIFAVYAVGMVLAVMAFLMELSRSINSSTKVDQSLIKP